MRIEQSDLRLYLITDPVLCAMRGVIETVKIAASNGVSLVQLRDKTASDSALIPLARELKQCLSEQGIKLIINDRLDLALKSEADGLHIGQGDMDPAIARKHLGDHAILGLSIENEAQAEQFDRQVVDYVGLGPIYGTHTKPDHAPPLGLEATARIAGALNFLTVGIGGIHRENVEAVMKTGVDGVAVISAICGQDDIAGATQDLKHSVTLEHGGKT